VAENGKPAELRVYTIEQPNGSSADVKLTEEQAKAAGLTGKGRAVRKRADQEYAERTAGSTDPTDGNDAAESKTRTAQNKARGAGSSKSS
jgi:hypothetical protein